MVLPPPSLGSTRASHRACSLFRSLICLFLLLRRSYEASFLVSVCCSPMPSDMLVSFTQTMWFSWLNRGLNCKQVSMSVTLGAFSGVSLFGMGPTNSVSMMFGPARSLPACHVHLSGVPLPVRAQGVVFALDLSWSAHVDRAWCHPEACKVSFSSSTFQTWSLQRLFWFGICRR